MKLIGLLGFAGSGKTEAATALINQGYTPIAFADALKDCVSSIFRWDRKRMAGDTPEDRAWREAVDPWWAERLGIANFSPRLAMTMFGTDTMREHFNQNIWVLSLERAILSHIESHNFLPAFDMRTGKTEVDVRVVLTDVRHRNEIALCHKMKGRFIRIRRGPEPPWWSLAVEAGHGNANAIAYLKDRYGVHESEWAWVGFHPDAIVENDSTLKVLHERVAGHATRLVG